MSQTVNLGHVVGPGVPNGGTAGQILKKNSATNFDTSWSDNNAASIPMSGSDNTSIGNAMSKILPVITGTTNNSGYAIAAGEYFEANGGLYQATASIPVDSAWSSSATALTDHGAVNALNSKFPLESKTYQFTSVSYLNGSGARCICCPVPLNKTPIVTLVQSNGGVDVTSDFDLAHCSDGSLFVYTWVDTFDGVPICVNYHF